MIRTAQFLSAGIIGIGIPLLFISAVSADVRHKVEPGDTLTYLSQVYAVAISDIVDLNGIPNPNLIRIGEDLLIKKEAPASTDAGASGDLSEETYTIQDGDTLSEIAAEFNVSIGALQEANDIEDPRLIIAGHTLLIPRPEPAYVPPPPLAFPDRPYDATIEAIIEEISADYGVDARTVKALATIESGWNQFAVSHAGAVGVMQLMPGTTAWLESDIFRYDLYETDSAYDNIKLGVKYLRLLLDSTAGNERLAVAAYYQGLTPTQSGVFYPDTADYVQMIFRVRDTYWP